jgi:hypothetical protein
MGTDDRPLDKPDVKGGDLPPIGEPVWVQCEGYRTLACRDKDGKWRTFVGDRELEGKVRFLKSAD